MKLILSTIALYFIAGLGLIQAFDHSSFDQLLKQHVSLDGKVDYKGFQKNRKSFDQYLNQIQNVKSTADWSEKERLAFYINAYNAFTIQLILDHYPVKSINEIAQPWDKKFFSLEGKKLSLNFLEHEILRKKFSEPRIHFAIVCASFSCPQLRNEAFSADRLEIQLNEQTRKFLADPDKNILSQEKAEISQLFSWFKDDFSKKGSVIDFINQYSEIKLTKKTKIKYLDYNWSLNE